MSYDPFLKNCMQYIEIASNHMLDNFNTGTNSSGEFYDDTSIFTQAGQNLGYSYSANSNMSTSAYDSVIANYKNQIANYKAKAAETEESENVENEYITNTTSNSTNSSTSTSSGRTNVTSIDPTLASNIDSKLGSGFCAKLEEIAKNINCDPNDLLALMQSESGLNPKAVNTSSGATGLIQFIPSTLSSLGYTTSQIKSMTATEQLSVVEKYFLQNKKTFGFSTSDAIDAGTLYTLCFLPACSKSNLICNNTNTYTWAYNGNKGLDTNGDGAITKSDLAARLDKKYQELRNTYA